GAIVAAVAPPDSTFNLYEFELDGSNGVRALTHTTGGATWPDISADGRTIVFVGYTVDGFDVFSIPYPPAGSAERNARIVGDAPPRATPIAPAPTTDYSPLRTLAPTSWSPVIEGDSSQLRL